MIIMDAESDGEEDSRQAGLPRLGPQEGGPHGVLRASDRRGGCYDAPRPGRFAPGKLWSLWKMLEVKVGRLLELHERLTIDKGLFERAHHELTAAGGGHLRFEHDEFLRLRNSVAELEETADSMNLTTTQVAANRTRLAMDAIGAPSGAGSCYAAGQLRHSLSAPA